MKRHPRYFILGYGHEDVRPLPKVSDDMIDKLYEKIIPYDGKHNEFRGTKREYVAKIIEVFGGMVGSGNGTDDMDDDEAEYEINKILDNAEDLLGQRDVSQRQALAALYGQSGVAANIGEFHEDFVEENVLNKLAEQNKLTDVTKFKDYKKDGKDIGAITDFGALKNGKTALFEVKTSLEAQPTKFVVAARTLKKDDDKFAKEYNILFTDTRDNTVKKLDITKLIRGMPGLPEPPNNMFNERFPLEKGKVNRLEMDGRWIAEWTRDGNAIMEYLQDEGYGNIITKKNGATMFKFDQTNSDVKKNIKTVYKETYVDPSQSRPMSSAAPAFVPTSARSVAARSVAADVDEREKQREKEMEMEKIRAADENAKEAARKAEAKEAKKAAKRAKDAVAAPAPAPATAATPIETKAQRKARLAAMEEAKKAEAAAIEEKKKAEREKSKQMAAELEAKKKAKEAEDAKKKAEEIAKKAPTTQKKSKDTKKKQKPVDDDDALFAEAAAVRAKYEAEQAAIKAAEAAKKAAAEAEQAARKAAERETLNTSAKAAAKEVVTKFNELKEPANTLIKSVNDLKTYNPGNFIESDRATVLRYNKKVEESGSLGTENMGYLILQFPYNLINLSGIEEYIKNQYVNQKSSGLPIETIVEKIKNDLITAAKTKIKEIFGTEQIEDMKSMLDHLKEVAAAIEPRMIIKPKK